MLIGGFDRRPQRTRLHIAAKDPARRVRREGTPKQGECEQQSESDLTQLPHERSSTSKRSLPPSCRES